MWEKGLWVWGGDGGEYGVSVGDVGKCVGVWESAWGEYERC